MSSFRIALVQPVTTLPPDDEANYSRPAQPVPRQAAE
jgi:hypothetical protein